MNSKDECRALARQLFAPSAAHGGCVKSGIAKFRDFLSKHYRPTGENRARELFMGRIRPHVEEIDLLREKAGLWCRKKGAAARERVEDKIDAIYEFVESLKAKRKAKREARLSQSSFIERVS